MIQNPLSCDDTKATANAVASLGGKVESGREGWRVESSGRPSPPRDSVECGESGVTLRFTIPIASLTGADVRLKGTETLMQRPIQALVQTMKQLGCEIATGRNEVHVKAGFPKGGTAQLRGDISSQFISGLLLAAPLMKDGLNLRLISPLESHGYVSLTIETMKRHGIGVESDDEMSLFKVEPGQVYKPATHRISGDYSSAAFLMSAAAVTGCKLLIHGLSQEGSDPDSAFLGVLSEMGVTTSFSSESLLVEGGPLKAVSVNISDCPDLGPAIAVLGCYANGETRITGAGRLRYKESDRLAAMTSELKALGAEIESTEDGLHLIGPSQLHGGIVDSHGDHRIAMALSIAAMDADEQVVIRNAQCVSKSYPAFFDDIRSLGVEVIER